MKARPIPQEVKTRVLDATVGLRPVGMAFLVNRSLPMDEVLEVVQFNSIIWGGFHNLLVPTNGKTLRDDWRQTLVNYDPDIIVSCGGLSEDEIDAISEQIQPFIHYKWEQGALKVHLDGRHRLESVPIEPVLLHLRRSLESRPLPGIKIPSGRSGGPAALRAAAAFGLLPQSLEAFYADQLGAEQLAIPRGNVKDQLGAAHALSSRTPLGLTALGLSVRTGFPETGHTFVLCGRRTVDDICLFWDLRSRCVSWMASVSLLSCTELESPKGVTEFAEYCAACLGKATFLTLASASAGRKRLERIRDVVAPLLAPIGIKCIDLWLSDFDLPPLSVYASEQSTELRVNTGRGSIVAVQPEFIGEEKRPSTWINYLRIGGQRGRPEGFVPPRFPGLSRLLNSDMPDPLIRIPKLYRRRRAHGRLSHRVGQGAERIVFCLPSEWELLTGAAKKGAFEASMTDKARYTNGLVDLMGGLGETEGLRNQGYVRLIEGMKDGTPRSTREMLSLMRPGNDKSIKKEANDILVSMALKGLLLRGYGIRCPTCDLYRWYSTSEVVEAMRCAGCHAVMQPQLGEEFRYRLNELAIRCTEQGCLPVLLALLFLQGLARDSFMHIPGVLLSRRNEDLEVDVDILASCDGRLVVCECKDLRGHDSRKELVGVLDDLERLSRVASDIDAPVVLLATLLPSVPNHLERGVNVLNRRLRNRAVVHVLLAEDLHRGHRMRRATFDPKKQEPCTLDDFLPHRLHSDKGWVRGTGPREMSF